MPKTVSWMVVGLTVLAAALGAGAWWRAAHPQRNVILFVADGLRSEVVTPATAPDLARVRDQGVDFRDSHSLFPTLTTPNASAIATGHRLGDTGDFANNIYAGSPAVPAAFASLVAPVEDDAVLGDINGRFGGNYLNETSLLAVARAHGFSTAAIGKLGPVAIQDVTARHAGEGVVIDDSTGGQDGLPLPADLIAAIKAAGLAPQAPDRGLNGDPGDNVRSGVRVANIDQQNWFARVAAEILLPRFKAAHKPFILVFWSRDPDGTQHNQGDSLNALSPGINGPTSMAAIRNASNDLARLRAALRRLDLDKTTDVVVTADHGFSTTSKQSRTSVAAGLRFGDVQPGFLPPGFLAIDLSRALNLPLYEPNGLAVDLAGGFHPRHANAVLGVDPAHPEVVVAANGGSDQIWLPKTAGAKALAQRIVAALTMQDYAGALFVDDDLGPIAGALPFSAIGLKGSALTPAPAIVISFRSESTGCARPEVCAVDVADTELQQGQGIHGSFSRADTHNFMAAIGPDFKAGFVDASPVSNADLAMTLARVLGLDLHPRGRLLGRPLTESLRRGGAVASTERTVIRSSPAANGFVTVLNRQAVEGIPYFDAAGAPGRVVGLQP